MVSWTSIKRRQARDADQLAAVASGIGEYGISNACYRLAGILRRQAAELEGEVLPDDLYSGGFGALRC